MIFSKILGVQNKQLFLTIAPINSKSSNLSFPIIVHIFDNETSKLITYGYLRFKKKFIYLVPSQ